MGGGELEGNLPFIEVERELYVSGGTKYRWFWCDWTQTVWCNVFMGDRWKRTLGSCYEKTNRLRNLTFILPSDKLRPSLNVSRLRVNFKSVTSQTMGRPFDMVAGRF